MFPDSLFMQKLLDIINLNLQKRLAFLYLQLGPANFLLAAYSKRYGHKGYRQKNKNAHMTTVRQTDTSSDPNLNNSTSLPIPRQLALLLFS